MYFDIAIVTDINYGMVLDNKPLWITGTTNYLEMFGTLTENNILLTDEETMDYFVDNNLTPRYSVIISKTLSYVSSNKRVLYVKSFNEALLMIQSLDMYKNKSIVVSGCNDILIQAIKSLHLRNVYSYIINKDLECQIKVSEPLRSLLVTRTTKHIHEKEYVIEFNTNKDEQRYVNMLSELLESKIKPNRTGIDTRSIGHYSLSFNLTDERGPILPILTTKKIILKFVFYELIWFLMGSTNTSFLKQHGISIWDGNTSKEFIQSRNLDYNEGSTGPIYGYQWRNWNGKGIDQLNNVINLLKEDPWSRRAVVSAWNPEQIDQMVLPPCHYSFQFTVEPDENQNPKYLNCMVNMRSTDAALGAPFNICSYSLLTHMVSKILNLTPGKITLNSVDMHLYMNHGSSIEEQVKRIACKFPTIKFINKAASATSIDEFINTEVSDYLIDHYDYYPFIRMDMVA